MVRVLALHGPGTRSTMCMYYIIQWHRQENEIGRAVRAENFVLLILIIKTWQIAEILVGL